MAQPTFKSSNSNYATTTATARRPSAAAAAPKSKARAEGQGGSSGSGTELAHSHSHATVMTMKTTAAVAAMAKPPPAICGTGEGDRRAANVERRMDETMLKQQGIDLLDTIMDHVLFTHQTKTSTLPYGKVTKETVFLAHNPTLTYHHGVSEKALDIVRSLCSWLVPKSRIVDQNNRICQLSIRDLYSTFWTKVTDEEANHGLEHEHEREDPDPNALLSSTSPSPPKPNNLFTQSLKLDSVEQTLAEFTQCSKILCQPRIFGTPPTFDRSYSASYSTMVVLVDQIVNGFEEIEIAYGNTQFEQQLRKTFREKSRKERVAAATAARLDLEKKMAQEAKDARDRAEAKKDVGTQKSLQDNADNVRVSIDDGEEAVAVEEKEEHEGGVDADGEDRVLVRVRRDYWDDATENEGKIKAMSTAQDEHDDDEGKVGKGNDDEDNESEEMQQQQQRPKDMHMHDNEEKEGTEAEKDDHDQDQSLSLEEIELTQIQTQKCKQLKQLMVEKLLGDGIERMVSVLDTFKYTSEYEPSRVIVPGDPLRYCC